MINVLRRFGVEPQAIEQPKDTYMISEIYLQAKQSGIACGVSNFYNIIRNPVYCGKITVPKYKDEEEYLVDGQHEALISEGLFYRVQDIINGKKRNIHTRTVSEDLLPLRGKDSYITGRTAAKRKIIGSMYPQNLVFNGF